MAYFEGKDINTEELPATMMKKPKL